MPDRHPAGVRPDLVDRVRSRLAGEAASGAAAPVSAARLAAALRAEEGFRGEGELLDTLEEVRTQLCGAGPLQPLLADPLVSDVLVNGPDDVWVDRGAGVQRHPLTFPGGEEEVRRLAVRLAAAAGRRLDAAVPFVDAQLADGSRLHAALPPLSPAGTVLSIRTHRANAPTLAALVEAGSLPGAVADLLVRVLDARLAFLVTGGTGSGKTTLLGALLGEVDAGERILLVEDAAEIVARHPHVVRLQTRQANVEGAGEVTLRDLVRQALRMRPDRIVVGEVRGPEVVDLLVALNTGHEGGCATLHANGVREVAARLEALASLAGVGREALHSQASAAVHCVVHLRRLRDGRRQVAEVGVLHLDPVAGRVVPVTAVRCGDGTGGAAPGPGAPALRDLLQGRGVPVPGWLA